MILHAIGNLGWFISGAFTLRIVDRAIGGLSSADSTPLSAASTNSRTRTDTVRVQCGNGRARFEEESA